MVAPIIARAVAGKISKEALKNGARSGARVGAQILSTTAGKTLAGASALGAFINATKNRNSQRTIVQNSNAKSSTNNDSLKLGKRLGHFGLDLILISVVIFLLIINLSSILSLIDSIVGVIFLLLGIPTGLFGFDFQILNYWYLFIIFFLLYSIMFMRDKLGGEIEIAVIVALLPIVFYFIFVELGNKYFNTIANEFILIFLPYIILAIAAYYIFIIGGFSQADEIQYKVSSTTEKIVIVLLIGCIALFLTGSSLQAQSVINQGEEAGDELQASANSFNSYFRCEILFGKLKGDPQCLEVKEEVVVKKDPSEVFNIKFRSDSSSNVVHEGSQSARFVFDLDIPSTVNAKLKDYTCFVENRRNDSIKTYQIPSQYSQLTTSIPNKATIVLECPIYAIVDENLDSTDVKLRLDFFIEDRITQFIPYVDCSDSFFLENPNVMCERIGEEYYEGNINDPRVETFLTTVDDNVEGAYSVDAKVTGLRGNLPLYLNSENLFSLSSYDYSIKFEKENGYTIKQVLIKNIQTPNYIALGDSIERNYSNLNDDEVSMRIDFDINDVTTNFIGNSLPMTIDYEIWQQSMTPQTKIFIRRPEIIEEDPTTVGDIVAGVDSDSVVTSGDGSDTIVGGSGSDTIVESDETLGDETVDEGLTVAP